MVTNLNLGCTDPQLLARRPTGQFLQKGQDGSIPLHAVGIKPVHLNFMPQKPGREPESCLGVVRLQHKGLWGDAVALLPRHTPAGCIAITAL